MDSDSRRDLMHLSREFKEGRETSQVTIRRASQAEGIARAKALRVGKRGLLCGDWSRRSKVASSRRGSRRG